MRGSGGRLGPEGSEIWGGRMDTVRVRRTVVLSPPAQFFFFKCEWMFKYGAMVEGISFNNAAHSFLRGQQLIWKQNMVHSIFPSPRKAGWLISAISYHGDSFCHISLLKRPRAESSPVSGSWCEQTHVTLDSAAGLARRKSSPSTDKVVFRWQE